MEVIRFEWDFEKMNQYSEKTWKILESAIYKIYNQDDIGITFEELYRNAYYMVLHKDGEKLYSGLVSTTTTHLKEIAKSIEAAQGGLFLEELNSKWEEYTKALERIRNILMYMDRTFVPSTYKTPVYELGLNLWRDNIIHSSKIQSRFRDTLIELVQKKMTGDVINRGLMRNIIKMFMDLGSSAYQEEFEKPFLDFYRGKSQQLIECCDCGDYLKKAERHLNEGFESVSHYLDAEGQAKITSVLEKEMIESHMHRLVHMENSGLVNMIVDDKYEDLGRMYSLFCRVPNGLSIIRDVMTSDVMTSHIKDNTGKQGMIQDILRCMDGNFIPRSHDSPMHELGSNLRMDNTINSSKIRSRLQDALLELVQRERTGQAINRSLMRSLIKMLIYFGPSVYQEEFEKPFLEVSADFYRGQSQQFIEHCDFGDYLKKAEKLLNEEIERVSYYLDVESQAKITSVVEKEMIESQMRRLVHMENSGLVNMIVDDKYEDLGRMYNLFRRVPNGVSIIREVMTSQIQDTGKQNITDLKNLKDPLEFVQRLWNQLNEMDKHEKIINLAFNNDKTLQKALNSSFEYFINLNPRSPEFISLFVDDKFRKGLNGVSEEGVEIVLEKVMMLFRYLQEKDLFEKYYRQHLAKRLLSGKTVSDDAERSLIVKLKTECGYQYTSKLEGMFNDMNTSQDTMQGFYSSMAADITDYPTLAVQILSTGSWPSQSIATCNLPSEILGICDKFRMYYLGTHTGRRLWWQTNMGTADLKATFGKDQKHELNVSTHQMCILMLFNSTDQLSYKEIEQATEIPASDLKSCLQSLACVKGKNVLRKEPRSKEVAEDDLFLFNDKFTNKLYKIKMVTVVAEKESELEKQEMRQRVEQDRKPQIEAAIVRIMKSRQVLDHNNIVAEVTKELQPRFLPNPIVIKKGIMSLIEREFLERDKVDGKLYRYLA